MIVVVGVTISWNCSPPIRFYPIPVIPYTIRNVFASTSWQDRTEKPSKAVNYDRDVSFRATSTESTVAVFMVYDEVLSAIHTFSMPIRHLSGRSSVYVMVGSKHAAP